MRSRILVAFISLVLAHSLPAHAGDTAQMEKLGAIRTRVATKFVELQKVVSVQINGVSVSDSSLLTQYQQSLAAWNKRIQQESVKPADTRDQALLDSLVLKVEKATIMWNNHQWHDGPLYTQQMVPIQDTVSFLNIVISALTPIDQTWVRADLDATQLTAVFANLDKRIDEVSTAATTIVENYKKLNATNEKNLLD